MSTLAQNVCRFAGRRLSGRRNPNKAAASVTASGAVFRYLHTSTASSFGFKLKFKAPHQSVKPQPLSGSDPVTVADANTHFEPTSRQPPRRSSPYSISALSGAPGGNASDTSEASDSDTSDNFYIDWSTLQQKQQSLSPSKLLVYTHENYTIFLPKEYSFPMHRYKAISGKMEELVQNKCEDAGSGADNGSGVDNSRFS